MNSETRDTEAHHRVTDSFNRQQFMHTLGARLLNIEPGMVEIELPYQQSLTQQHGFLHAGVISTLVDNACGYAAFSLMPAGAEVLTIEFKINLLSPARGERLIARGRVAKAGRTISVCNGEAIAVKDGEEKVVAQMVATMMCIEGREDVRPVSR